MAHSDNESQRRRWWRGRHGSLQLRVIAVAAGIAIVSFVAWHYRYHLLWKYELSRNSFQEIRAIPGHSMPLMRPAEGWEQCRVGRMQISLPPELANSFTHTSDASLVTFEYGPRAVVLALPTDENIYRELLQSASQLCPQQQRLTWPRLRRACYQVSSEDFRWSMTPEELRWHRLCITMSRAFRLSSEGDTESFFRSDLHGFVHFVGDRGVFDWHTADGKWSGYIHFIDRSEDKDRTWIRAACQSIRILDD
jgi:hypothetical protein